MSCVAKTGWPRLADQGQPALAAGNAEISQSLALEEAASWQSRTLTHHARRIGDD